MDADRNFDNLKGTKYFENLKNMHKTGIKVKKLETLPSSVQSRKVQPRHGARDRIPAEMRNLARDLKLTHGPLLRRYKVPLEENLLLGLAKDVLSKGYYSLEQAWSDDCFLDTENLCLINKFGRNIEKDYSMSLSLGPNPANPKKNMSKESRSKFQGSGPAPVDDFEMLIDFQLEGLELLGKPGNRKKF
jgi:hypothetical protein